MDEFAGQRLISVLRLAWDWPGDEPRLQLGPVCLRFANGRNLVLSGSTDFSLDVHVSDATNQTWLRTYDYDYEGGRWRSRDASQETPFASVVGRAMTHWDFALNEMGELVGLTLWFDQEVLEVTMSEGEVWV